MITFVSFLLNLKEADSAIGDLARDVAMDNRVSRKWGFNKFMDHITTCGACEGARMATFQCMELYTTFKENVNSTFTYSSNC